MGSQFDLRSALRDARAKAAEAGRDVVDAVAKYNPQRLGQELGTQAARALVDAARRAPPPLQGQLMNAAAHAVRRPASSPPARGAVRPAQKKASGFTEGLNRVGAFVNGAGDAALLGAANHVAAFQSLKSGMGVSLNPIENYKWLLEQEKLRDRMEEANYPVLRGAGTIVGTVAPIVLTGGASAAPQGFARIAPHAAKGAGLGARALARRFGPQAAVAFAGGTGSAAAQVATDAIDPRKRVNLQDTAAAWVGGSTGALGTLYGSPRVGAVTEAVATELTRSALTGEKPSIEAMSRNAVAGSYLGKLGGDAAMDWSNRLPGSKYYKRGRLLSKEELGEQFSEWKSRLRGEGVRAKRQQEFKVSRGDTRADHVTRAGRPVESKFGYRAKLTDRQKEARVELADYRIDHFTPDDVGKGFGGFLALIGGQAAEPPERGRPTTAPHATRYAPPRSSR